MSSKKYKNRYTFSEFFKLAFSFIMTKVFYRKAKLICYPISMRGKKSLVYQKGLNVGYNCRFDLLNCDKKTLFIGKNCEFGDNCHIVATERVIIGDNFLCASKVFISDTSHGNYSSHCNALQDSPLTIPSERQLVSDPVEIGNNVWVGENVVVLKGSKIGDGCIIGANSVVNGTITPYSIAVGAPAKEIKRYDFAKGVWLRAGK